jgi:thiol-disulfide isomerase/thioredoxin
MKWLLIGLCILFIIIAVFVYRSFMKKKDYNPNNEFVRNDKMGQLMLFYADWCPYSQTTLKKWYTYKETYNGSYNISFSEIDCDKNTSLADDYNIESYPTIILLVDGKKYIYDAEMNAATLSHFVNTIMK